jgi:deoxyribonuclease-4
MARIGAHVSVAGGLLLAIERAETIGATCLQIFSSPPQQWKSSTISLSDCQKFKAVAKEKNILPVFVHGTYLINLASENEFSLQQSKQSLIEDLQFCSRIGSRGVIFQFGSNALGWEGKKRTLVPVIHDILEKTPSETQFVIENSAGSGNKIGSSMTELSSMVADTNNTRVKICLDTAHAFAAGNDLRTPEAVDVFIRHVEATLGWDHVVAIHLNDSKVDLGSKNDRHENIGAGKIGLEGFRSLVNHPLVRNIPFILEVPGFEKNGPDQKNIDIVTSLCL